MKEIKQLTKILIRESLGFFLFWISYFLPRNNRIWVFGTRYGEGYEDNPKYLFEYINKNKNEIRAIWLSRNNEVIKKVNNLGYEIYNSRSIKGMYLGGRASVIICSHTAYQDVGLYNINRARIIQLWHGTPLKKIVYDDKKSINDVTVTQKIKRKIINYIAPYKNYGRIDLLISSTENINNNLLSAFRIEEGIIKVLGYPRNDILLSSENLDCLIYKSMMNYFNNPKIAAYLPTFNYSDNNSADYDFLISDIYKINKFLEQNNSILILRYHPFLEKILRKKVKTKILLELPQFVIEKIDKAERIILGNSKGWEDFYPLLKFIDILITDYSSIYFDFLLLNKPIIFFEGSNKNLSVDRGFYYNYNSVTPGPKAKDWNGMLNHIELFLKKPTLYNEDRLRIQKQFNKYIDSNSSQRVFEEIKRLVNL